MQTQPKAGSIIAQVGDYLSSGRSLTPVEAQTAFGTMRLASAIEELRNKYGYSIRTIIKSNPVTAKTYASYSLRPTFKVRDRVQLIGLDSSLKDNLFDGDAESLNTNFEGVYVGNYGRVTAVDRDNHVQVQFKNGGSWFVHVDDLNFYRGA